MEGKTQGSQQFYFVLQLRHNHVLNHVTGTELKCFFEDSFYDLKSKNLA